MKDFQILHDELRLYKDGILLEKPSLVVVNKSDRSYTNFNQKYKTLAKYYD